MEKIPCTAAILTYNSAKNLPRALESVKDFAEIIICDGSSTDETLAIAGTCGAHIIAQNSEFKNPDNTLRDYAGVRNQCLDAATHDWFFYIDSDEEATPELVSEVRVIASRQPAETFVYNISPRIVLDGRLIGHSSNYPGWQKRFFNRGSGARFRKAIHERITYDEARYPAGYLAGHWHYFVASGQDVEKNRRYALMDAKLYATRETGMFLRLAVSKISTIAKVVLKSLFNRFRYGSDKSMPLAVEWTRVAYQWNILRFLTAAYFGIKL
ncbi:MAG: glycosyltransferase family 2 protein [bacterium]